MFYITIQVKELFFVDYSVEKKMISKTDINVTRYFIIFLYLLFNIILLFVVYQEIDLKYLGIIVIVDFFVNYIVIIKFQYKYLSLPSLFLIFTYILHLGHLVLMVFNAEEYIVYNVLDYVTLANYIEGSVFVIFSQSFLVLGLIVSKLHKSKSKDKNRISESNSRVIFIIGLIFLCISIVPKLSIDINKMILYAQGGYLNTYNIETRGSILLLSQFFEISIIMILISKRNSKYVANFVYYSSTFYSVITMFNGNRFMSVVFIIASSYIYFNLVKKITFKTFLIASGICYIGMSILTTIGEIRQKAVVDINQIYDIINKNMQDSVLFDILGEFGTTNTTLIYSIMFSPVTIGYNYGMTYFYAFLKMIIPNAHSFLNISKSEFGFVFKFPGLYSNNLGGSYLGEAYYNFGYFSYIFVFFIGLLIGYIDKKIIRAIANQELVLLSILMLFFMKIIIWCRDYFYILLSEPILFSLIIMIMYAGINNLFMKSYRI